MDRTEKRKIEAAESKVNLAETEFFLSVLPLPPTTKTCLNNFDILKPHFYMGFTVEYIFIKKTLIVGTR